MSLWGKIQALGEQCQGHVISSLYSEEHQQKYKFPIEVRYIFAELIENAVCGGNINSLDAGLDPANPNHGILISSFLTCLIGQLENWLRNAVSPDLFLTKLKIEDAFKNLKENVQTDALGTYEHIRNRIKAEMEFIAQTEAATSSVPAQEQDAILENIQSLKNNIAHVTSVLEMIRQNEENFAINSNKKQQVEAILANPEPLQRAMGQITTSYMMKLQQCVAHLDGLLPQNIQKHQNLMLQFEHEISNNITHVTNLQYQVISEKIKIWKHEQQRMANENPRIVHSVHLDKLQVWCEELAEATWKNYEQLEKAEFTMQNGLIPSDPARLTFVQGQMQVVNGLLQKLLNESLIVESQPQVIHKGTGKGAVGTRFSKPVIVSLLAGRRLNIHMNRSQMTACILSDEQVRSLPDRSTEPIGEVTNNCVMMDSNDPKRIRFEFENMALKTHKRYEKTEANKNERVLEEKYCMYFECQVTVGPLQFKIYTTSLPVAVICHTAHQEQLAMATILWDNAFAEMDRLPFEVKTTAAWADVAEILNGKVEALTGRGLTKENLDYLAKKAFRNRNPLPETLTWEEFGKIQLENLDNGHLPQGKFTFWAWFHSSLYKVIGNKESRLKELWAEGLFMGYVEKEKAESLLSRCRVGTFLLRFSDSLKGAITITLLYRPGKVISLDPLEEPDLKTRRHLSLIKELKALKFLYTSDRLIPKYEAFGKFYEVDTNKAKAPAVKKGLAMKAWLQDFLQTSLIRTTFMER